MFSHCRVLSLRYVTHEISFVHITFMLHFEGNVTKHANIGYLEQKMFGRYPK